MLSHFTFSTLLPLLAVSMVVAPGQRADNSGKAVCSASCIVESNVSSTNGISVDEPCKGHLHVSGTASIPASAAVCLESNANAFKGCEAGKSCKFVLGEGSYIYQGSTTWFDMAGSLSLGDGSNITLTSGSAKKTHGTTFWGQLGDTTVGKGSKVVVGESALLALNLLEVRDAASLTLGTLASVNPAYPKIDGTTLSVGNDTSVILSEGATLTLENGATIQTYITPGLTLTIGESSKLTVAKGVECLVIGSMTIADGTSQEWYHGSKGDAFLCDQRAKKKTGNVFGSKLAYAGPNATLLASGNRPTSFARTIDAETDE